MKTQKADNPSWVSALVELRGFEPLTFSLRTRRATNCAIAPCFNSASTLPPRRRVPTTRGYSPDARGRSSASTSDACPAGASAVTGVAEPAGRGADRSMVRTVRGARGLLT